MNGKDDEEQYGRGGGLYMFDFITTNAIPSTQTHVIY